MSLFGSLYVGTSGIQASQNALNTTAHNMSNVDTRGYTRQMVMQSARQYNTISANGSAVSKQQIGLGVVYAETKTVRDQFLDKAYRKESGRSAFYDATDMALEEVEVLLQELEGEAFGNTLTNLWSAVQNLSKEPSTASYQNNFVQYCSEFLTQAGYVYDGLCNYQDDINRTIKTDAEKMNEIGREISTLNQEILQVELGGTERANDLRDRRNYLLDELSKYSEIEYQDDLFGNVIVRIEGNDFIKSDSINEIAVYTDKNTGFHTPYWPQLATTTIVGGQPQLNIDGAMLFNLERPISTAMNTDIGGLKSKMLSRGDHRATYNDLTNVNDHYDKNVSPSIIMNIQAEFDQLINLVTKGINDILTNAADPATGYLIDKNTGAPLQMFDLAVPADGYTTKNLLMNQTLKQAPTLLDFIRNDDLEEDFATTDKLKGLFSTAAYTLNPNTATQLTLSGYYGAMVDQVANTADVARDNLATQEGTVEQLAAAREQIIGVSSDEELSNMVMFQNAYNASSRYINVISELLEHVINSLGR